MENPNRMWLKWKLLFLEVCDNHTPIRTKRVRDSGDRLKIIASVTKTAEDWSNFKTSLNQVNNAIKNAKRSYYYNTFKTCDGNSRKAWKVINEVTSRKSDNL